MCRPQTQWPGSGRAEGLVNQGLAGRQWEGRLLEGLRAQADGVTLALGVDAEKWGRTAGPKSATGHSTNPGSAPLQASPQPPQSRGSDPGGWDVPSLPPQTLSHAGAPETGRGELSGPFQLPPALGPRKAPSCIALRLLVKEAPGEGAGALSGELSGKQDSETVGEAGLLKLCNHDSCCKIKGPGSFHS